LMGKAKLSDLPQSRPAVILYPYAKPEPNCIACP
jgi:hypothetical protein